MSTVFKFIRDDEQLLLSFHAEGDRFTVSFTDLDKHAYVVRSMKNARIIQQLLRAAKVYVVIREFKAETKL